MASGKSIVVAAGLVAILGGRPAPASADPRAAAVAKTRAAMASYDLMEYQTARKQLAQALTIAKKAKLDKDPVAARIHLVLAITQLAAGDDDGARQSMVTAVTIDPKIAIDPAYKSPELVKLL